MDVLHAGLSPSQWPVEGEEEDRIQTWPEFFSQERKESCRAHQSCHSQSPMQQAEADWRYLKPYQPVPPGGAKERQQAEVDPAAMRCRQKNQLQEQDKHDLQVSPHRHSIMNSCHGGHR